MTSEEKAKKRTGTEIPEAAAGGPSAEQPAEPSVGQSAGQPADRPVPAAVAAAPMRRFPSAGDVLAMLGIALGAQIVVSVAAMLLLLVAGHGTDMASLAPQVLGRTQAIIYLISMTTALVGVLYYRRVRGGRGPWAQFSLRGFTPALLLCAFLLLFAAGIVLEHLLRLLPAITLNVFRGAWPSLMLVGIAPILEVLLCRGVGPGSLRVRSGLTAAWLVSAIFVGVLHMQPAQVVNATVVGLILGFVYLSTESMWSVMILHALNNAVAYFMLMAGYEDTMLIEMIDSRTLYVVIFIAAVALLAVSGYMMARALRRMKSAGEAKLAGEKNPRKA